MKKLCRIIISLAISITILFACFGIVDYTIKKVIPSFDKDLSLLNFTFSPLNYDLDNDGIVNYSERKFHIPTQSERLEMNNLIEKITKASKKSGYKQQILAMREQFFDRYYYPVFTSYTIAQIEYYKDTTNELWIKNYNDIYDYYVKIDEIALKLEQNLINSIYKEEIEKVTNYEYTTSIATSEQISEKQKQLNEQEKNLTNKYIQNRSNEQEMADILKNLVITRNNLAKTYKDKNGNYYENYLDFAYQKRYNRSYSPQQALDFCELILKYFKNFGYAMDNYRIFYINLTPKNEKTLKELTRSIIRNTSDQFTKTWDYMIERDLYDFSSRLNKMDQSFVTQFEQFEDAFMFINPSKDDMNKTINSILHEFGHYNEVLNADINKQQNPTFTNLDLLETHSQAFELISLSGVKKAMSLANYKNYLYNVLYQNSWAILSNCIFSEFEYEIYNEKPENLTLQYFKQTFSDIWAKYYSRQQVYDFYDITHIYTNPAYCISYSVSLMLASQIWAICDDNTTDETAYQNRLETYNQFVSYGGGNSLDFILDNFKNISQPFDEQTIIKVAKYYQSVCLKQLAISFTIPTQNAT